MSEIQISIGRVKREISQLVNRVAFGEDRIVLTSRGKPKAVIVSLEDYARIQQSDTQARMERWKKWQAANQALSKRILAEWQGAPVDLDEILVESRQELEERHADIFDA